MSTDNTTEGLSEAETEELNFWHDFERRGGMAYLDNLFHHKCEAVATKKAAADTEFAYMRTCVTLDAVLGLRNIVRERLALLKVLHQTAAKRYAGQ